MKNIISIVAIIFSLGIMQLNAQKNITIGFVFIDINNNNLFDVNDTPLSKVAVSSLDTIVQTNENGQFTIPTQINDIVFIIKPEGFQSNLQENGVPQFYQMLYRNINTEQFNFDITQQSTIPDTLYFPLYQTIVKNTYSAYMIGDIQAPGKNEVQFFQELIVPELFKQPSDFNVCLGDIADNNLAIYPEITNALKWLETPTYMAFGNHDTNYKAANIDTEAESYRKHFGPDYYSFNYGNTHFVVLNTVNYKGWNSIENKKGNYTGGVQKRQLNWLKQDLNLTPIDKRIVLMAHIPLLVNHTDSMNISNVFSTLVNRKDILAIYGHLHATASWDHSHETLWYGNGNFKGQIAGAACGGWWVGPFGHDSIPSASCNDGSPAGVYRYEFQEENYSKQFIPAGKDPNYQMRISDPSYSISADSLNSHFVYVNVFDGNDKTLVQFCIDNNDWMLLDNVIEADPFIKRNQQLRINRENWSPKPSLSSHLWKAQYPKNLTPGKHIIKAKCTLSNGKKYSCVKIFEVI